jgi:hypothetical protein
MTAQIVKFPFSVSRKAHARKPRASKNGTPEERAAKAAPLEAPADVVLMSDIREEVRSQVDGRKLRGSPLRDYVSTISFGATIVGKMHTAGLRGEPLAAIEPDIRKDWLFALGLAIEAVETVATGLLEAKRTLKALQSENSEFPVNLPDPALGQSVPTVLNLAADERERDH